jgi:hypothetical protein
MKQGFFGGGTVGFIPTPVGSLGGGLYFDSYGNLLTLRLNPCPTFGGSQVASSALFDMSGKSPA